MQTSIKSDGCVILTFPSSFDSIENTCHFIGDFEGTSTTCAANTGSKTYTLSDFPYDATTGEYTTAGNKNFFVYATPGTMANSNIELVSYHQTCNSANY